VQYSITFVRIGPETLGKGRRQRTLSSSEVLCREFLFGNGSRGNGSKGNGRKKSKGRARLGLGVPWLISPMSSSMHFSSMLLSAMSRSIRNSVPSDEVRRTCDGDEDMVISMNERERWRTGHSVSFPLFPPLSSVHPIHSHEAHFATM